MLNSKLYQKFIEDAFEDMMPYQETNSDDAYFFIEVPYLDLDKLKASCNEFSINLNLKYATMEEILSDSTNTIDTSLKGLFTSELTSYVEIYIIRAEPVIIKARYAVVCILTTPTNYRTMGLLGSYFKKHGEDWRFYRFPLEQPSKEELEQLDGKILLDLWV